MYKVYRTRNTSVGVEHFQNVLLAVERRMVMEGVGEFLPRRLDRWEAFHEHLPWLAGKLAGPMASPAVDLDDAAAVDLVREILVFIVVHGSRSKPDGTSKGAPSTDSSRLTPRSDRRQVSTSGAGE